MDAQRIRLFQWGAVAVVVIGGLFGIGIAATALTRLGDGIAVMVGSLVVATALWCVALAQRTRQPLP
jgi:hypothetical protein